jgi:hypothetical protein
MVASKYLDMPKVKHQVANATTVRQFILFKRNIVASHGDERSVLLKVRDVVGCICINELPRQLFLAQLNSLHEITYKDITSLGKLNQVVNSIKEGNEARQ